MANYIYNQSNLENEVDFDFFDDQISQYSDSNNNAVIKSTQNEKKNVSERNNENPTENEELKKSSSNHDRKDDTEVEEEEELSSSNSVRSLNRSNISSVPSSQSRKSTSENRVNTSSSSKQSLSQHKSSSKISSDEESDDVTSVSSLESDNLSEILPSPPSPPPPSSGKPKKKTSKQLSGSSKYHTHLNSSIDMDLIPTEVILQAMMSIHEERRHMQKMKPKWIDPNSKDYSMSGITLKMNLVPERIVSMPKKNIRKNPFFCSSDEIDKRLYHTAINRGKEKDRISKENQAIKSRLQQIRPSPGITKEVLLREYSKLNRFSVQPSSRSRVITITPSYRPHSSTNSINDTKVRRNHSSTAVSRFVDSRQSNSVKSTPKRVMSENSLASKNSRHSNQTSINRRN